MNKKMRIIPLVVLSALGLGCRGSGTESLSPYYAKLDAVPQDKWLALSQKKIFFGHKSVGMNVIDGLKDVLRDRPSIKLEIRESADAAIFSAPVFAHAPVGSNFAPQTKIDHFREIMHSGVGRAVDIAFYKFCFVDVGHSTDVMDLASNYADTLENLSAEFPNAKLVPMTVPLLSGPVGLKSRLKKLLGRLPNYDTDHIQRSAYNDILREKFKGRLFDIAAVESRFSENRVATLKKRGREYEILYSGYTYDGGHLNSVGRQIVAIELLLYLSSIV